VQVHINKVQNRENLDPKKRKRSNVWTRTIQLEQGKQLHTNWGIVEHDVIIGKQPGIFLKTSTGMSFLVFRPTIVDSMLSLPRGAAIVYPKDAGEILMYADIKEGLNILECGLGSGALTLCLLRAAKNTGQVVSVERREDFVKTATRNIENFFGKLPSSWTLEMAELSEYLDEIIERNEIAFDRIILDLLDPWEYLDSCHQVLKCGGIITCYITTVTALSTLSSALELRSNLYSHIEVFEIIRRPWHVDGLSIRPEHQGIMHSGFILTARVLG
jgi:tRNA (adenine57-N1/adenine58-N1)-methyltransferase